MSPWLKALADLPGLAGRQAWPVPAERREPTIAHSANNLGALEMSAPVGNTWQAQALVTTGGGNGNFTVQAFAICSA